MNNSTTNSITFTPFTKGPSQHPYLEMLRDGAQNCSIVPQEKLDWSWLKPVVTSNASIEEPRMRHHFTISVLVKNITERKAKLRSLKISKYVVKYKE